MGDESSAIRVLLVDFSQVIREGLLTILSRIDMFTVLGDAPDHTAALRMAAQSRPDVVLTELYSDAVNGIALVRQLRDQHPEMIIMVLSQRDGNIDVADAVSAGANGYMLINNVTDQTLLEAIDLARSNTSALDSDVISRVLTQLRQNAQASLLSAGALSADLSQRELDVLRLLASGRTDREIADELGISLNTVNRHVRNVVGKLGAGNRIRAALMAAQAGIIELPLDEHDQRH